MGEEVGVESNHNDADVQAFNRRATTYETSIRQGYLFDRVQRNVLALVKTGSKPDAVLDVGCGTGRLLRKAREQWPNSRLIGVDAAEKMVEQATQLFPEAEFHFAMAESLPLADASVDVAFSPLSFHDWGNQAKGVSEVARVLRPQGRFLLADIVLPFGLSFFNHHFKRNDPKRMREMFKRAGLKVELQQRQWRWSRFLVVIVGLKTMC
jgi:ubiquinone/menaquinone biosynthesis C-methylase UbiE